MRVFMPGTEYKMSMKKSESTESRILFKACDGGGSVETPTNCAKLSLLVKNMLETIGEDGDVHEVPVVGATVKTLTNVTLWMERHRDDPQPSELRMKPMPQTKVDAWDRSFLEALDLQEIFSIIKAANFLNIPGLIWVATREVAMLIRHREPSEIRAMLGIPNEWDTEELRKVRRESSMCSDQ